MSCDAISIDLLLYFFLHSACDYSYFILSIVALYNVLLDKQTAWRWANVFRQNRRAIKEKMC